MKLATALGRTHEDSPDHPFLFRRGSHLSLSETKVSVTPGSIPCVGEQVSGDSGLRVASGLDKLASRGQRVPPLAKTPRARRLAYAAAGIALPYLRNPVARAEGSHEQPGGRPPGLPTAGRASMSTNARTHGVELLLIQACIVPRCTTTSPAETRVVNPSSSSRSPSQESTIP